MATTAHTMSNLDVPTADDMDMHSDSGLDFGDGDGDIELDLEPAHMPHTEDDDVSIVDAASDVAHDAQLGFEEQDDFMVDPEDVIEEDDMYADGEDTLIAEQPPAESASLSQAPVPAPLDEDLIDYSDDEGEQPAIAPTESREEDMAGTREEQVERLPHEADDPQISETVTVEHVEQSEHLAQGELTEHNTSADETNDQHQTPDQSRYDPAVHGDGDSTDGDEGGVALQEEHSPAGDKYYQPEEQTQHDQTEVQLDHEDEHQEYKSSAQRSITVNYAGNELWLFKQHDPDDSGDWLLDDLSLTKSRISDVFQACRTSLGDDVSNEHEIGFRFDHLHNLELYEDNTACVAVSLDKLVDLYHTLQTQDGNNEPESFYISLLFRPRFATLLSDIAKFADDGSGYAALNAAVAAGETHFTNEFSESPSEQVPDWDNQEHGDAATEGQDDSPHSEAQQGGDESEHTSQQHDTAYDEEQDDYQHYDHDEHSKLEETLVKGQAHAERTQSDVLAAAADDTADLTEQHELAYPPVENVLQAATETLSEADARRAQEQDDIVDYSDDEDETIAQQVETASVKGSSPSSSTVQGDDTANAEPNFYPADSSKVDAQKARDEETEVNHDDEEHVLKNNDAATQSFQDYVQQNYENDEFETLHAEGENSFSLNNEDGNNANEEFAGFDYEATDEQLQLDFTNESELYNEGADFSQNDYTESDAFLDLDNAPAWVTDQEPDANLPADAVLVHDNVEYVEDEESGVAKYTAAAVTSDATAAAVSSSELNNMSPQGHKRSIDEAGHGTDDALDSIDTKRPKV
ncbi:hypothetical protein T440DRAFT_258912 [Plenodomus tracheiphilus IPT5]|uniref:Uncharacterized protein n=1 Tax=Plenodomus tracheiphilus IPT5 TaxID=1408161 RepID=A0A6A7AQU0_9PLEO|nr:hypothetical protein T440DRAFT_258912 [Plenodomus tracheiphilus IPT5]